MAQEESQAPPKSPSNAGVITFIILLCFICGFLLALASFLLSAPQKAAKEFDQSKQMLVAAKILNHKGQFQLLTTDGLCDAYFDPKNKTLVAVVDPKEAPRATADEIKTIAAALIRPLLTDKEGKLYTLEEKGVTLENYLNENKKVGYAALPLKLLYAILPSDANAPQVKAEDIAKEPKLASSFVIPVSGFGLWAPIYGYIAIAGNGDEVIGTTWYEHGETPGLGANIVEPWWQSQFYHKVIFQESSEGQVDFKTAPIGIIVVKGKVQNVFGNSPKSKSAVDGMSGATLTGDGVTAAYRDSLTPYRQFFIRLTEKKEKNGAKESSP